MAHNQYVQHMHEAGQAAALRTRNKLNLSTKTAFLIRLLSVHESCLAPPVAPLHRRGRDGSAFTVVRQPKQQDAGRDTRAFAKSITRMLS
jgi:hypothetical protein